MKILISKEQFTSFYNTFNDPEYVKKYAEENRSNWRITISEHFNNIVRRHIVGGANRTLISVKTPLRLSRTGTDRRITAE